jgi:predicted component of type VI protein secretion system
MKEPEKLSLKDLEQSDEASVRRLARFVGLVGHDTLPLPVLIDELGWKGVVRFPWPTGCY